jgi:hypothetical protein
MPRLPAVMATREPGGRFRRRSNFLTCSRTASDTSAMAGASELWRISTSLRPFTVIPSSESRSRSQHRPSSRARAVGPLDRGGPVSSSGVKETSVGHSQDRRIRVACLRSIDRAGQGQGWRKRGYGSKRSARYDDLSTRGRHLEGSASPCRPHNHPTAGRVGDPGVILPLERSSETSPSTRLGE